jgi:hypothetical protein
VALCSFPEGPLYNQPKPGEAFPKDQDPVPTTNTWHQMRSPVPVQYQHRGSSVRVQTTRGQGWPAASVCAHIPPSSRQRLSHSTVQGDEPESSHLRTSSTSPSPLHGASPAATGCFAAESLSDPASVSSALASSGPASRDPMRLRAYVCPCVQRWTPSWEEEKRT